MYKFYCIKKQFIIINCPSLALKMPTNCTHKICTNICTHALSALSHSPHQIVPPKITPFGFVRDLNVGDRTSIQCVVGTGDLPLVFTWLKDDVPLQSAAGSSSSSSASLGRGTDHNLHLLHHHASSRHDLMEANGVGGEKQAAQGELAAADITIRQYDDFTSSLSITSVSRVQAGNYTCRVQNDAATAMHSAILRVNGI